MIQIYTSEDNLKGRDIIRDSESFFKTTVPIENFEEKELEAMMKIDEAKLLDIKLGMILTPFGITTVNCLSTGCKVILNYLFLYKSIEYRDYILDVTECGANALECLFYFMEQQNDSKTILLLRHRNGIAKCGKRSYLINGKKEVNRLNISI